MDADSLCSDSDFIYEASSNGSYQAAEERLQIEQHSSLVTDYEQRQGGGSLKSQIMIVDKDGEEKLNPMRMVMLGMKDPKMLV